MIHIFLVDDHKILRKGLKFILELDPNLKVVGEANSVREAISTISSSESMDIVITGINLPNESGLELIKYLTLTNPRVKSIVFSMNLECSYALKAMEIGASGYVTKNSEDFELVNAILEVYQGNTFVSQTMEQEIKKNKACTLDNKIQISPRELEVLNHIVEGWSNKMIGDMMYVSESTVNTHRYHIMKKLNAKNTADLVRIAFSKKLVTSN
jgi:two-component system invasion response regulator UvrY